MATALKRNSQMSDAEWEARQQLAACYRIFDMLGWSEMIYNHITLRVPDEPDAFLINPYGLHYSEVCASNLVKIDIDGNKLDDNPYPVNLAGFVQHGVFHRHVPDAHCIMHTHTTEAMAVSSVEGGLAPNNFYGVSFYGQVAYHDFEGITVRHEEGERLVKNLGDKRVMLLKHHGLIVMGETLPEAFFKHYHFQRACEVQLAIAQMGKPIPIPPEVIEVHQRDLHKVMIPGGTGQADFAAMVRKYDKIDTSWRN